MLLTSIYLLVASSQINACDQESCRYANVLNSGNEAIDKTNMRGQQTKIHYLAIRKHTPSSRAKTIRSSKFGTLLTNSCDVKS